MRIFPGRVALVVTCFGLMTWSAARADSFSPSLEAYETSALAAGSFPVPAAPAHFAGSFAFEDAAPAAFKQQSYWPVLYSALIPGLGELTMGYEKRGIAFMVVDALAWTGYFKNHSDGMDERAAYEQFADTHWSESRWVSNFPNICPQPPLSVEDIEKCGKLTSGQNIWPGYIPYVPRDEDKQHYYENLGKYDWYISGWDDWKGWDTAAQDYHTQTDNRTTYRSMRQKSNDSLDDADAFLWVNFAMRAFSIAQAAIIIHNQRGNTETGGGGGGVPVTLEARPRGYTGGEVALEVRF